MGVCNVCKSKLRFFQVVAVDVAVNKVQTPWRLTKVQLQENIFCFIYMEVREQCLPCYQSGSIEAGKSGSLFSMLFTRLMGSLVGQSHA